MVVSHPKASERKIDPVLLEVIHHRLMSIGDEMMSTIFRCAYSPIVVEAHDATTAIFDVKGRTVAQALGVPLHLGNLMTMVPKVIQAFPVMEMQEGDIYIANDPYIGGTHLNDMQMLTPVIYQGEVVALIGNIVHLIDIGSKVTGTPGDTTSIYQEGLKLPPVKFYEAGKPVEAIHAIIRRNVRVPDLVMGDIKAQVAASNTGKRRLLEVFEEYGKDVIFAAMEELLNHSEVLTRQELMKIPDGSYSFVEYMDSDGIDVDRPIKIQVTVTIKGSDLIADFSGTSPQVKGPYNCVPTCAWAAAAYLIRAITGGTIPSNDGCFRPITLKLPEGSIVNPRFPAAVACRAITAFTMLATMFGALATAVPERACAASYIGGPAIYFAGIDPLNGREYIAVEVSAGGQGARPTRDGFDVITTEMMNTANVPVETIEMTSPIRVLRSGLWDESGGAGEYRGGLGLWKVFKLLRGDSTQTIQGEHQHFAPWGIFGGLAGSRAKAFLVRKTGEKQECSFKGVFPMREGEELHLFTSGGGGYGDPLKRKPELVLQDVLNKRVSVEGAAADYGVVIDEELMSIDWEKTAELRKEREKLRGPITWTYDRGPERGGRE